MYEDTVLWALISLSLLLLIALWDPLSYIKIADTDLRMHVLTQNAENQICYEIYHLNAMHGAYLPLGDLWRCRYQRSPGQFCCIFNFKYES